MSVRREGWLADAVDEFAFSCIFWCALDALSGKSGSTCAEEEKREDEDEEDEEAPLLDSLLLKRGRGRRGGRETGAQRTAEDAIGHVFFLFLRPVFMTTFDFRRKNYFSLLNMQTNTSKFTPLTMR